MFKHTPEQVRAPKLTIDEYQSERKTRLHDSRRLAHLHPVNRLLAKTAITVGIGLAPVGLYIEYDVGPERARLSQTHPDVISIYEANDPRDDNIAVVDMVGLGNLSAEETAITLSSYADIGNVWAVQYDNEGVDTAVIAEEIVEEAEEQDVDKLVLSGHSMGGDVALKIADHLYTQTDIDLMAVILDCTPPDIYSVRQSEREKGLMMIKYDPLFNVIDGGASRAFRFVGEMVARKEQYMQEADTVLGRIDFDRFGDATKEVYLDKILKKDVASTDLIGDQFGEIYDGDALGSLDVITDPIEGKDKPVIVYMRPKNPFDDPVVDVSRSQKLITSKTDFSDLNLLIVKMDNTGHANPNQSPTEYNNAIQDKIIPFLERKELERQVAARLAYLAIEQAGSHLAILEPR